MKKAMLAGMICVLLIGCASVGGISSKHYKDLKGDFDVYSATIAKRQSLAASTTDLVTLNFFDMAKEDFYTLDVHYDGPDWRFMEPSATLKINNRLFDIKGVTPTRKVLGAHHVTEALSFILSSEIVRSMKNAKTIFIQFHGGPVEIKPEGMEAIRKLIEMH